MKDFLPNHIAAIIFVFFFTLLTVSAFTLTSYWGLITKATARLRTQARIHCAYETNMRDLRDTAEKMKKKNGPECTFLLSKLTEIASQENSMSSNIFKMLEEYWLAWGEEDVTLKRHRTSTFVEDTLGLINHRQLDINSAAAIRRTETTLESKLSRLSLSLLDSERPTVVILLSICRLRNARSQISRASIPARISCRPQSKACYVAEGSLVEDLNRVYK